PTRQLRQVPVESRYALNALLEGCIEIAYLAVRFLLSCAHGLNHLLDLSHERRKLRRNQVARRLDLLDSAHNGFEGGDRLLAELVKLRRVVDMDLEDLVDPGD